jgi:hypothetical protein
MLDNGFGPAYALVHEAETAAKAVVHYMLGNKSAYIQKMIITGYFE